jgi:hypothetical protein
VVGAIAGVVEAIASVVGAVTGVVGAIANVVGAVAVENMVDAERIYASSVAVVVRLLTSVV